MEFTFSTIGQVQSCFKQKFGIPRQPGLAPGAEAVLHIEPPFGQPECWRAIENYSHLWVIFLFHATAAAPWHSTVRPPRFGGDKRIGVFASRSNFRPNPVGLSVVRFKSIRFNRGAADIVVENHDLLDKTPILDVKPYIGFCDAVKEAVSYDEPPQTVQLEMTPDFSAQMTARFAPEEAERIVHLLRHLIGIDPRPAYLSGKPDDDDYAIVLDRLAYHYTMRDVNTAVLYAITIPGKNGTVSAPQ